MARDRGLTPEIGKCPKVVILGSFPGEVSLTKQEYYANAGNQFWKLIEKMLGIKLPPAYTARIITLKGKGIALWDVIESCNREGSSDSKIRNPMFNSDIPHLAKRRKIKAIFFNGREAERYFNQNFPTDEIKACLHYLPSSSGANNGDKTRAKKWRKIKLYI